MQINNKDRYVYIMLSHTGTWFSQTIRTFSDYDYTHASISLTPDLNEMYSFGRTDVNNPFSGGFVVEGKNKGVYDKFKNTSCCVYKLKVDNETYVRIQKSIIFFKENQEKYKYNFIGVLAVPFNKTIQRSNAYFCSQFVAHVLHNNGVTILNKNPNLATPNDFRGLKELELIYEGKLKAYQYQPTLRIAKNYEYEDDLIVIPQLSKETSVI